MSKKIAIVDIDGTLIPESKRLYAQASAALPFFNTNDVQEFVYRFFEVNDYVVKNEPEHKNDIPYYMERLALKYDVTLSPADCEAVTAAWEAAYRESNTEAEAFPGAAEFLSTLKARGYELIFASGNTRESRLELLEKTELLSFVDGLLAAKETGFQKQQSEFWDELQARFPQLETADHVVMIGNQLNDDALHPTRLGYKVFIVKWPGELDKVRFGADSAVSKEMIDEAQEQVVMTAPSLRAFLDHPDLQ